MSRGLLAQSWLNWKRRPSPGGGSFGASVSADRELLRQTADAENAFQATFLVLAAQGGIA